MFFFLFLGKLNTDQDEKTQLRKRYLDCIEKLQVSVTTPKPPLPTDSDNLEVDSFCNFINAHLKKMPLQLRTQAQEDIMKVVNSCVQKINK